MMRTISLLLLSIIPRDDILRDRVDVAEVNHYYDDKGVNIWSQIIWYDWSSDYEAFVVVDYRVFRGDMDLWPARDHRRGGYVSLFQEHMTHELREVRAGCKNETWTQFDPEKLNEEIFPKTKRRMLCPSNVRNTGNQPLSVSAPSP